MKPTIVLVGGSSTRMKPYIWKGKEQIEISDGLTLIGHQNNWLFKHGFQMNTCREKGGTGGGLKKCWEYLRDFIDKKWQMIYVMNCDDIVFYNPNKLWNILKHYYPDEGYLASILLTQPKLPFGEVVTESAVCCKKVTEFKEKPVITSMRVSCGHYVFRREVLDQYLPDEGQLEDFTLPKLTEEGLLTYRVLKPDLNPWFPVNNIKQLQWVREYLKGVK
jgi:NDP-sugar pyrophosphorylase family protein